MNEEDDIPMPVPFTDLGSSSGILGNIVDRQAEESGPVPPRRRIGELNGGAQPLETDSTKQQDGNQQAPNNQHVKNLRSSFETRSQSSLVAQAVPVQGNMPGSRFSPATVKPNYYQDCSIISKQKRSYAPTVKKPQLTSRLFSRKIKIATQV